MLLVTADEMRRLDERAIREAGIPAGELMENAGCGAARMISERYSAAEYRNVLVISGQGHNGGDGLVVARRLQELGYEVDSWLIGSVSQLSATCKEKLELLHNVGIKTQFIGANELTEASDFDRYHIIVDAIIGIGRHGNLRDPLPSLLEKINNCGAKRVALDIATGINADTGEVANVAFRADLTITFALAKRGHFLDAGSEYTGELVVVDIGIPEQYVDSDHIDSDHIDNANLLLKLITPAMVANAIPKRAKDSHKGSHGHALVVGGSRDMPGAPALAAKAAMRVGAGLVTMVAPDSIRPLIFSYLPEAIFVGVVDVEEGFLGHIDLVRFMKDGRKYSAACYGCGVGRWSDERAVLELLLKNIGCPLVIDADGLNALAEDLGLLAERQGKLILTPHPGEMARLLGISATEVNANRVEVARKFAIDRQVYLVLKGADTVVATPDGEIYLNKSAGPELAKGGTGDVLAGMITGLIAQGIAIAEAICSAVYLHGVAGRLAKENSAEQSVIATDVIEEIGTAMMQIIGENNQDR